MSDYRPTNESSTNVLSDYHESTEQALLRMARDSCLRYAIITFWNLFQPHSISLKHWKITLALLTGSTPLVNEIESSTENRRAAIAAGLLLSSFDVWTLLTLKLTL